MTDWDVPPIDRYCDLVMKGGIASGVVYPEAIAKLSHYYRFQSIGGTSAGAIAASVTAAAEYQRRLTGSRAGFDLLKQLPTKLGDKTSSGKSKLLSLFQPQPPLRRLFSVLIGALNRKKTSLRIWSIIWGLLRAYWPATVSAGLIAVLVGFFDVGWFAACLTFVLVVMSLVGQRVYSDVTKRLVAYDLGLCTGLTEQDSIDEALTPWLHHLIQTAAGRAIHEAPVTFGDLWLVRSPLETQQDRDLPRSIELQMFSTNLSHGRPYIFPLADSERLYFTTGEMRKCLPDQVVKWMVDNSPSNDRDQGSHDEDKLLQVPAAERFPILLAARMSLSFPFLFTAIPLHAIETDRFGKKTFRPCWFSDGGISSNFPIHLFDDLVPRWPTFGLTLEAKIADQSPVFLATTYDQGYEERWNIAPDNKDVSMLGWFVGAIVSTMQNWNDNSLTRMPGVRDRVARVRLEKHEGGMNLNMEAQHIHAVAKRGVDAIDQILGRFAPPSRNGGPADGWDEHRFVRLHVLLKMLAVRSQGITDALRPDCRYATDFGSLFTQMMSAKDQHGNPLPPPGYEKPLTPQQCQELKTFVMRLEALAKEMQPLDHSIEFSAIPTPELRIRPPL